MATPDSSEIDYALMTLLENDAALHLLMPDGVYDEEGAKQNAVRWVSVTLYEHEDVNTFQQGGYENALYLVEAVSRSGILTNMKGAAKRIHDLLQDGTLSAPGFTFMGMYRERRTRTVERDPVDKSIRWFRRGGYYRVQMALAPTPADDPGLLTTGAFAGRPSEAITANGAPITTDVAGVLTTGAFAGQSSKPITANDELITTEVLV